MVERSAHFRSANTRLAKDIDAVSIEKISNAQRDGIPLARDSHQALLAALRAIGVSTLRLELDLDFAHVLRVDEIALLLGEDD